ncbi:hypothetical protein [Trichlorobacter lovleyi]|uniref:hypothetical protein n=1 Tax=Trichlorobacter lovleyi TaxID=313985 RepID=UPI0024805C71|nr:hypothetical protein [Trichlorobacter lovleyi]
MDPVAINLRRVTGRAVVQQNHGEETVLSKLGLKPWAERPFELINHAEIHFRRESDYDRRLAIISFDNSIEVSITTYLTLHPSQRGNRSYENKMVEQWLHNFHSKSDFFLLENKNRGLPEYTEKGEIVWYHEQRNECYHGGGFSVPTKKTLEGIRKLALWVFSVLYDTTDVESMLEMAIINRNKVLPSIPDNFVVPQIPALPEPSTDPTQAKALTVATLLGKWDENNKSDLEIIRRLADGF